MPPAIVAKAKACLLYAMAVGIASMKSRQANEAARAIDEGSTGGATRFYDDRVTGPSQAAFANGALFHARVQDDAPAAGHVGVVVTPAAIAMAQAAGADGRHQRAATLAR
ncbi:MAG: MmgE/PrpD family protein [Rhodospirillales bacterium]